MAAHTERMKRFKEAIFKQREEINNGMAKMFELFKELTASRTPKKVLVREGARHPVTKNFNVISLVKIDKEKNTENNEVVDKNIIELSELNSLEPQELVDVKKEVENKTDNEAIRSMKEEITGEGIEELVEMPRSQPIGYYLKHEINKELIEGLLGNQTYNDSLLATRLGKMEHETYNSIHVGPMYNAILKKKITKNEDIKGNSVIPCNIGGLKYMDIMPFSIFNRLNNEKPVGTNIRLSIASYSYIFPLGIAEDVLVKIAGYVYPVDFMILDVKKIRRNLSF
uniref:Reverse transcriptase domain-containing protein n=1 Tax=Tanacetum cinerariifolium TaxID=118510 RepID=A0A6L2KFB4_TANCI|nr:hypothetical protein [Tanacetum cinerariifolium]